MIQINRASVSAPGQFIAEPESPKKALEEFVAKLPKSGLAQRTLPFRDDLLRADDLREALIVLFRRTCAFCESHLAISGRQNVEHFRPRQRAAQLDGKVHPLHYWWLAYEWRNLYAICSDCRSHKGPRFPVKGRRAEYNENDPTSRQYFHAGHRSFNREGQP
jgi:uncharacterized protein (TIGR02646 family)